MRTLVLSLVTVFLAFITLAAAEGELLPFLHRLSSNKSSRACTPASRSMTMYGVTPSGWAHQCWNSANPCMWAPTLHLLPALSTLRARVAGPPCRGET